MTEATGPEIVSPELLSGIEVQLLIAAAEQAIEVVRVRPHKKQHGYMTDVGVDGTSHIYRARDSNDNFNRLLISQIDPSQSDIHLQLQRYSPTDDHLYLFQEVSLTLGRSLPTQLVSESVQAAMERSLGGHFQGRSDKHDVAPSEVATPRQAGEAVKVFLDVFLFTTRSAKVPQQSGSWLGRLGLRRAS